MQSFVDVHLAGEYASEVGSVTSSVAVRDPLLDASSAKRSAPPPLPSRSAIETRWPGGSGLLGLDAYSRHKKFINDYVLSYGKERASRYLADKVPFVGKTDGDVLRENHRFIRSEADDDLSQWEKRMAKKYYDKLFKEYAIADLSGYKKGKVGLRWRTQQEVVEGLGQFRCGSHVCSVTQDLRSFEMNFSYMEDGEKKNALVKLRLCPDCAIRLNYRKLKQEEKEMKKEAKRAKKRRKSSLSRESSDDSSADEHAPSERQVAAFDAVIEGDAVESCWTQLVSKSTGKLYWYNTETGATQWHRPVVGRSRGGEPSSRGVLGIRGSNDSISEQPEDGGVAEPHLNSGPDKDAAATHARGLADAASKVWAMKPQDLSQPGDDHDEYFEGLFL